MRITTRCPKCKDDLGWYEFYNPSTTSRITRFIIMAKGFSPKNYVYRCSECGYSCEYPGPNGL